MKSNLNVATARDCQATRSKRVYVIAVLLTRFRTKYIFPLVTILLSYGTQFNQKRTIVSRRKEYNLPCLPFLHCLNLNIIAKFKSQFRNHSVEAQWAEDRRGLVWGGSGARARDPRARAQARLEREGSTAKKTLPCSPRRGGVGDGQHWFRGIYVLETKLRLFYEIERQLKKHHANR